MKLVKYNRIEIHMTNTEVKTNQTIISCKMGTVTRNKKIIKINDLDDLKE